jgi:hypothetical protein
MLKLERLLFKKENIRCEDPFDNFSFENNELKEQEMSSMTKGLLV